MRIAFYAPHKPIEHPVPSGDLFIAKSLFNSLASQGHDIRTVSKFRTYKAVLNPQKWISGIFEFHNTLNIVRDFAPDLWLTYHSYYKSPDILGPRICDKLDIPYTIYQGVFSTKRRRQLKNWPGFMLNKAALIKADHIFANKKIDFENLSRIILPEKLSYSSPGIKSEDFKFSQKERDLIRGRLKLDNKTVIFSVAMFRQGVKEQSLIQLIKAFKKIESGTNKSIQLLIAGDGDCRDELITISKQLKIKNILFLGAIPRSELFKYYSAADIFAYPGIGEALGMVYLEAQASGLPAVAYATRGPSEAISHNLTGILTPEGDIEKFSTAIIKLIENESMRKTMSANGPIRIKNLFEIEKNFSMVGQTLVTISQRRMKWKKST